MTKDKKIIGMARQGYGISSITFTSGVVLDAKGKEYFKLYEDHMSGIGPTLFVILVEGKEEKARYMYSNLAGVTWNSGQ